MGEAADMVLDGYLDCDGSYNGDNNATQHLYRNNDKLYNVLKLLASMGVKKANRYLFIMEYGVIIGKDTASQTAKFICSGDDKTNWNDFKRWIKENHKMQCET